MAIQSGPITLNTTATLIRAATVNHYVGLALYNPTTDSVYLGPSTVSTSGMPLASGDRLSIMLYPAGTAAADDLYGCSTGTVKIYYLLNRDAT